LLASNRADPSDLSDRSREHIRFLKKQCRNQIIKRSAEEPNVCLLLSPDERPGAFRYRDRINAVEEMIVDALPDIAKKLISMAKDGDVAAARYLFDRMAGRPSKLSSPPSHDREIPYTGLDWCGAIRRRCLR